MGRSYMKRSNFRKFPKKTWNIPFFLQYRFHRFSPFKKGSQQKHPSKSSMGGGFGRGKGRILTQAIEYHALGHD